MANDEETMCDHDTIEAPRDGVCKIRLGNSEGVNERSAVDSARNLGLNAGWTLDSREHGPSEYETKCASRDRTAVK